MDKHPFKTQTWTTRGRHNVRILFTPTICPISLWREKKDLSCYQAIISPSVNENSPHRPPEIRRYWQNRSGQSARPAPRARKWTTAFCSLIGFRWLLSVNNPMSVSTGKWNRHAVDSFFLLLWISRLLRVIVIYILNGKDDFHVLVINGQNMRVTHDFVRKYRI